MKYSSYGNFINDLENDERNRDRRFGSTYFDLIENEITEDEKKITELIDSYAKFNENMETLINNSVFDKTFQLQISSDVSRVRQENLRSGQMVKDQESTTSRT